MKTTPSVLFIGKKGNEYCERASELVSTHFPTHAVLLGNRGDAFPEGDSQWLGDYIISYLSPWVLPERLLRRATRAAINFHPGPPEYPGIGCTNFAIYNRETSFGVTCHHMVKKVDAGEIIAVRRFPLHQTDTVWTLTQRCYSFLETLFQEIVVDIENGSSLSASSEKWTRPAYTRVELEELCRITADMSEEEVSRRVRAVTFPNAPGAFIEVAGFKFILPPES